MPKLLAALSRCSEVYFDGQPVKTSSAAVLPHAYVEDRGDGFLLSVKRDPTITEVFQNGVVLCGDTLRPVGESGLNAREREELPERRYFAPEEMATLVTEILPALRQRILVEVQTHRLPSTTAEPPRLFIRTRRDGDRLHVEPALVYGGPPTARVENRRLVALGHEALPIRDERAEQRLARQLQQTLKLAPGKAVDVTSAEAIDVAERLKTWPGEIQGAGHEAFFLTPPLQPRWRLDAAHFDVLFETAAMDTAGQSARGGRAQAAAVLHA